MYDLDARTESIARSILDAQAAYLAEAEEMRAEGYRMPTCFHGTNQWVDYDAICGGCEDGAVNQYSTVAEVLAEARDRAEAQEYREGQQRELDHVMALMVQRSLDEGLLTPQEASAGIR